MTTKAQIKAQWIAASEDRLVEYAQCPPIVKSETAAIAFSKSILRAIRAEQKARQAVKVAA